MKRNRRILRDNQIPSEPNLVRVKGSRMKSHVGYVLGEGETINAHKTMVGKPREKRHRCRKERK
jgi:hypothetical protein